MVFLQSIKLLETVEMVVERMESYRCIRGERSMIPLQFKKILKIEIKI